MTKKVAYISNELQLQNHSFFLSKNTSLASATDFLSRLPMAHNTTASLVKVTSTDYVDFGKSQDRFGQFSWSKYDSNFLDVKVNKEYHLVQSLTMGEADFNQFLGLRNHSVIAAENFARVDNLTSVLIPTKSKDMN